MKTNLSTRLGRLEDHWNVRERKTTEELFQEAEDLATRRSISLEEAFGIVCNGISIHELRRLLVEPASGFPNR